MKGSSDCRFGQKRWFDRSDMLMASACTILISASLLILVPSIGTVFAEILAGVILAARASLLRARQRRSAQLPLELPTTASRIRLPDRYELVLIIVIMATYGAIAATLHVVRTPEIFIRIVPLLLFAAGLCAKHRLVRAIARSANCVRERLGRSGARLRGLDAEKTR